MTMYADKALQCVTCGADFVFTVSEQQFHASKGFTNEPRRCPACRQARRGGSRSAAPVRPDRAPARTTDGGGDATDVPGARSEAADAAPATTAEPARQRFTATCSACGGEAVLPFEPVGNRPVLCSGCYDKIRTTA